MVDAFARGEKVTFTLDGTEVALEAGDVLTEPAQKPGFTATEDKGVTVVLDTNLTPELIREGYAREVISKLQTMRKEADFEVTDRIEACWQGDAELSEALEANRDMIQKATLAVSLKAEAPAEGWIEKAWDINGKPATLAIRKA